MSRRLDRLSHAVVRRHVGQFVAFRLIASLALMVVTWLVLHAIGFVASVDPADRPRS